MQIIETKQKAEKGEILLRIRGLCKSFGPVTALDHVDLEVRSGEILGLIGENGSGKSTISSIFSGMQRADAGQMFFHGKVWHPDSMNDALAHGIGMIVQENGTVPGITVAENLFLCDTGRFRGKMGWINRGRLFREAQAALDGIGAGHLSATAVTATLDMTDRKLIEVAKVWMRDPEILVVDESTTALSQVGREIIYGLMRRMKESGRAVIFISHDLDEIMEKCDTLTVLRDGKLIRTFEKSAFDADAIRTSMIGRELRGDYYRSDYNGKVNGRNVLEVRHLCYRDTVKDVSFSLKKGEILGIGGLSQCGMHPLGKLLFGALRPDSGKVLVGGHELRSPAQAIREGVGYAAKDRDAESLCTVAPIRDNIAITGLDKIAAGGFLILPTRERAYVREQIDAMKVKCFSMDQPVSELSGGNKQKVVFGKWIGAGSQILILDCPTRGIDIGVKQMMYQLLTRMKREGKSIVMISEELTELIGMSDRLLILKNGSVTKEFARSETLSDAEIISYMV